MDENDNDKDKKLVVTPEMLKLMGISPPEGELPEEYEKPVVELPDSPADDLNKIRERLYEVDAYGKLAMKLGLEIVQSTSHPRALEVFSNLIDNVGENLKKIVDVTKEITNSGMKTINGEPAREPMTMEKMLDVYKSIKEQEKKKGE